MESDAKLDFETCDGMHGEKDGAPPCDECRGVDGGRGCQGAACQDGDAIIAVSKDDRQGVRNKELGKRGEEAAARYLYLRGYEILERNWECFAGEADIIARDGDTLVFVEVKTRRNTEKGFPSEAVGAKKRKRYEKIALAYVEDYPELDVPVRFDVVSLVVVGKNKALLRHHINAFTEM